MRTIYKLKKDTNLSSVIDYLKKHNVDINNTLRTIDGGVILECDTPKENVFLVAKYIENVIDEKDNNAYLYLISALFLIGLALMAIFIIKMIF